MKRDRDRERQLKRRKLKLEFLESRVCLDAGISAAAETRLPTDVNHDSYVSTLDALLVINALVRQEAGLGEGEATDNDLDVDDDGHVSSLDALLVINDLVKAEAEKSDSTTTDGSTSDDTTGDNSTDSDTTGDDTTGDSSTDSDTTDGSDSIGGGDTTDDAVVAPCGVGAPPAPLASFDSDGDGLLTESELPAEIWAKLSSADSNGDGSLSEDEILAAGRTQRAQHLLDEYDANDDGSLIESETPTRLWQKLTDDGADTDGDSAVSLDELIAVMPSDPPPGPHGHHRGPEFGHGGMGQGGMEHGGFGPGSMGNPLDRLFADFDANSDSLLGEDELPAALWTKLVGADTDGDGLLSSDELTSFIPEPPARHAPPMAVTNAASSSSMTAGFAPRGRMGRHF